MKIFIKEQIIVSIIIFCSLLVASYFYSTHKTLEQENKIYRKQISFVSCFSTKRGSEIEITDNSKKYSVNISTQECYSLKPGNYIDLLYNKNFDYYFVSGKSKSNLIQVYILSAIFIVSLLPWKKWIN